VAQVIGSRIYGPAGHANTASSQDGVRAQAGWFIVVSAIAFLVPFVFSSGLELQHDWYYLIYFAVTVATLGAYVRLTQADIRGLFTRNWKLSAVIGAASAAFVVWSVLGRIDSTPHPNGFYFAFEIVWRGLFYGTVDALLLSAFPGLVAWQAMGRDISGIGRRVSFGVLTLALVMTITAVYHLGFKDLRNSEGIRNPEIGNTVISLPVIVSANPIGSIAAHTSMHLAAVTHSYESKDRLPPQVFVDSDK
jgi:hypothetical protein